MTEDEAGPTVSEHYTYQKASHVACEGWTPRYVEPSSLCVYKVMGNGKIPHSVRYQIWPNTFNSKAGLQSRWRNNGKTLHYLTEDSEKRKRQLEVDHD